jgi:branched-chain amino acid transport system substrate-binding protein
MGTSTFKRPLAAIAALVAATTLAACSSSKSSASGSSSSTIKIGELVATSGTYGGFSSEESQGRKFVLDQVNAAGGVNGHKLEMDSQDWRSDTSLVASQATTLLRDGVVAVLGPDTSTAAVLLDQTMASARIPMISSAGLRPTSPYSFTVQTLDYFNLAMQFAKDKGATQICDLGVSGASFEAVQAVIHPAAAAVGLKVGKEVPFDATLSDLTPQVTQLKAAGCTAIFSGGSGSSLALVANAMAKLGMSKDILMSQGSNATSTLLAQMGDTTAFTYFPIPKIALGDSLPSSDPKAAEISGFLKAWTTKFGEPPTVAQAIGVANMDVLVAALKSGATTGPAIKSYLENGTTIHTPFVPYNFSADNHAGAKTEGYYVMARWDSSSKAFVEA